MMMSCRLLCALLVLALCCCPSVCAATSEGEAGEPGSKDGEKGGPGQEMDSLPKTLQSQTKEEGKGSEKQEPNTPNHTPQETATVTQTPKSQTTSNKVQEQEDGRSNKEEADIDKDNSVTLNEQNEKPNAPTTTTTTKTSSTTTTTTITQAPSTTTTTGAPTTTTTRAPSSLREIDGSLSSSAWVCAPLLLAASALA
ncbi:mucin TcMUCII [Trypanosoma cruzi cruzi]|uniref:Putative mucin TcMUCII n=1 Tax=Trypanosoma cruzi TaxID=5693 RepID=A0A2V2W459_TRYCR|nr:mucin TcMUCII [Trypanosoma cruzi cruzi]PWV03418.1 putative mucin TcMUCII [Trypanosoma cruzi]